MRNLISILFGVFVMIGGIQHAPAKEKLLVFVSAFAGGEKGGIHAFHLDTETGALTAAAGAQGAWLGTGDVLTAAHSFMDSAILAQELGHAGVVTELVKKAERLSYSPLIAKADREDILNRIASGE